ncbi:MAG TPA: isochorismatase family protein [Roseiflexaceae bacterium]|nr:isochorismatase family protein [Roseiflexaceae bacterium]
MQYQGLIDVDDTLLVVIDVQTHFLAKLPPNDARVLSQRICWLIGVARWLEVPLVVTAEDIAAIGGVDRQIVRVLPDEVAIFDKHTFGLAGDPAILAAVEQTGRRTAVLVGLETDVCVAQSALGLLDQGYRVAVVADATGSPDSGHAFGIERMRDAGVIVISVKGLFYEWVRTVEMAQRFRVERSRALGSPEGIRM